MGHRYADTVRRGPAPRRSMLGERYSPDPWQGSQIGHHLTILLNVLWLLIATSSRSHSIRARSSFDLPAAR